MTPHQIVGASARLFAVWMAVHLPGQVYEFVAQEIKIHDSTLRLIAICVAIVEVLGILTLWCFPHLIARKLLGPPSTEPPAPSSADTWLRMGCALIGLWLLAVSVPALILDLYGLSTATFDDKSSIWRAVLYYLAEAALGVWLILGGSGFRRLVWWARNAGIGEPSNNRWRGP